MKQDDYVLEVPHDAGCCAVGATLTGEWPHPWGGVDSHPWGYSKPGRHGNWKASVPCVRFRCNDPTCPATLLVRYAALMECAPSGLTDLRPVSLPAQENP